MTTYLKIRWEHDNSDDPLVLYHEIGEDRMELRRVEVFDDGRVQRADSVDPDAATSLSWEPLPSLDQIREQPEFTVHEISGVEFNIVWARGHDWGPEAPRDGVE